jgi:hypothetical protein
MSTIQIVCAVAVPLLWGYRFVAIKVGVMRATAGPQGAAGLVLGRTLPLDSANWLTPLIPMGIQTESMGIAKPMLRPLPTAPRAGHPRPPPHAQAGQATPTRAYFLRR